MTLTAHLKIQRKSASLKEIGTPRVAASYLVIWQHVRNKIQMELKRISGQRKSTLLEFYDPKEWPSQWKKMPEMMSELIKSLKLIDHEPVWVFTSHAELLFTNKDDYQDWQVLVKITEMDNKQYYKITAAQDNPWHHLTGFTDNHHEAAELVVSGLSVAAIGKNRNIFLDSN